MTHYLITTCCKEKDETPGELPAIRRYRSERIARAFEESRRLGLPMLILSGKFGLLQPQDPIPWYDHPLQMTEVPGLIPRLAESLAKGEVTGIYFIARPPETPGWAPYHTVLKRACQRLEIPISFIEYHEGHNPFLPDQMENHLA